MQNLKELLQKAMATDCPADKATFQKAFFEATFCTVFTIAAAWQIDQAEHIAEHIFVEVLALPLDQLKKATSSSCCTDYMAAFAINYCKDYWKNEGLSK